jgi:TRAP-type C4-dicarboxylate transport system permease small subunit
VSPGRFDRAISIVCRAVLWMSTVVIFAILVANTALRYVTGSSLQWASEVPELLFPWLVVAGVVMAAQQGAHIATTFIVERLAPGPRRATAAVTWLLVAALYVTLSVATWKMLGVVHDEKSPILQLPGSITYGCVLGGMVLLAALSLQAAWRSWHAPGAPPDARAEPRAAHW